MHTDNLTKLAIKTNDGVLCGPALGAADEIDRLRAEIERLRKAIRQADDILEGCGFAVELGARRVLRAALSSTGEKV